MVDLSQTMSVVLKPTFVNTVQKKAMNLSYLENPMLRQPKRKQKIKLRDTPPRSESTQLGTVEKQMTRTNSTVAREATRFKSERTSSG